MKVTREEGFKPIIIILDSEEEADVVWHLLNIGAGRGYKHIDMVDNHLRGTMWEQFNEVHRPKGIEDADILC